MPTVPVILSSVVYPTNFSMAEGENKYVSGLMKMLRYGKAKGVPLHIHL